MTDPDMKWLIALLCLVQALAPRSAPADTPARATQPNFIVFLGEGQGWSSTSVDMDGREPSQARPAGLTPSLERIAAQGVRFSSFYANAPRCTPARASFFTGISPAKLHMTYINEGGRSKRDEDSAPRRLVPPTPLTELPAGVRTTGDVLRAAGYATAHFGKWHVGRTDPTAHGFDLSDGPNTNQGPERGSAPNPAQSTAITERGLAFIEAQVKAGKPFFVQMSHYGAGTEEEVSAESLAEARALLPKLEGKGLVAAAGMRDLDKAIGRVLAALEKLGVDKQTYVFFSTDHGAPGHGGQHGDGPNPPFSGGKGSVSEGGIRVPFLVRGPGIAGDSVCNARASGMDLLPTLLELAGAPLNPAPDARAPTAVEGSSLAALWREKAATTRASDQLVIHFPHYDLDNGGPASAIFAGSLKLVRNYDTQRVTLFDVVADPAELHDLASELPDKVKELSARLDAYLKNVDAQMPTTSADTGARPPADDGDTRRKREKEKKRHDD